ncbi:MAG: extracellular solute-binding protein [Fibrobacterota bacterium]
MVPFLTPPCKTALNCAVYFESPSGDPVVRLFRLIKMVSPFLFLLYLFASAPPIFAQKAELTLLIKMIPAQEEWFVRNVLKPFEREYRADIRIEHFSDYDELDKMTRENRNVDVVKVPMDRAATFHEKDYITPLSDLMAPEQVARVRNDFIIPPLAMSGDTLLYIPRKLETRILVYRISKVQEAATRYREFLPEIDSALKSLQLPGLPDRYVLESDPNQWDYYDVLVAGYTWLKVYKEGRIGHRGKNYGGTFLRVVDRAFQLGAIRGELPYLNSNPVSEAFAWEWLYARMKLIHPRMYKDGWTGEDLWKAFGDDRIFLAFLTQLDCFFLLGTGENGLNGFLKNPDDIEFSVMPLAASLTGRDFMMANRNITTGGWFWAVSRTSVHKNLALKLIQYMTSEETQKKEFEAFGVLSSRKTLLKENKDEHYLKRWRNRMLQTSARQLQLNRTTQLPTFRDMDKLQSAYLTLLQDLCQNPDQFRSIEDVMKSISVHDSAAPKVE